MTVSLARACAAALLACVLSACTRSQPALPPHAAQTTGTLHAPGLHSPVTVVRDEWGIPHIKAANTDDLFFAQGFVQAQDRLFQMDLWKRASQGRLSEVLGANFASRDSMTRRIQFRGNYEAEWTSYGPGTREIATAFTNGINAWVRIARHDLPEEFVVAGWTPELWKPEDLLNRTDAFLASGNALDDLFRARLTASVGSERANNLFPLPDRHRFVPDPGVDLSAITFLVPDVVRRIGTAPFFLTLAAPVSQTPRPGQRAAHVGGSPKPETPIASRPSPDQPEERLRSRGQTWLVDTASSATGAPLVGVSLNGRFVVPHSRYLVHLTAPGWNVIGATSPWLPGVVVGHNDRVAWAMTPTPLDSQDIFVERVNPADPHQVERDGRWVNMAVDHERIWVNSRDTPLEYEREYTPNGAVIARDAERHLVYTLRWSGTEPGGAGELAALALNRASSAADFSAALGHWKMPIAEFVFADVTGGLGRQTAGILPVRPDGAGSLPGAGWSTARTWKGFTAPLNAREPLPTLGVATVADLQRVQTSVSSPSAQTMLALIGQIRSIPKELEPVVADLTGWDARFDGIAPQSRVYLRLISALRERIARELHLQNELIPDVTERIDVASMMAAPPSAWLGPRPRQRRDELLVNALSSVVGMTPAPSSSPSGTPRALVFRHLLAVFDEAKQRFDVGPFVSQGSSDTVLASAGGSGATLRAVFDVGDWNRSSVALAPGQSGSPASPHYDDLARSWASGQSIPLVFDQSALASKATDTLILQP